MCQNNQKPNDAKENGQDVTKATPCCGKCADAKKRWDFNAVSALIPPAKPTDIQNSQGIQPNG